MMTVLQICLAKSSARSSSVLFSVSFTRATKQHITLYFFDDERHKLPHIHAKYQGQDASFSILDGALLAGSIPTSKSRLVQAWIEVHREALLADWTLAVNGETPFPIEPLR